MRGRIDLRCGLLLGVLGLAGWSIRAEDPAVLAIKSGVGDWPGFRGADRTGISKETGLLSQWPKEGPKLLWKVSGLGGGFSTPSMFGGKIYLMGSKGQPDKGGGRPKGGGDGFTESVICLNQEDGKEIWSTEVGNTMGGYPGPRSTPTIEGGMAYAVSSNGNLVCLKADTGDLVWKKDYRKEYGGRAGAWAFAESPLIDGDVVVCTPGGAKAALVALNKKDGKEIWRAPITDLEGKRGPYATAGYASVIVARVHGVKQYIQFLSGGVVGIEAETGKLLWNYDRPANQVANCSTVLFKDNSVFAATAYNTGGGRARIDREGSNYKAEELFFIQKMQNHHGGMLLIGDHIYGTGSGSLMCVDFKDGKEVKSVRAAGKGSVTYADGHIYHRGEDGTICLVEANPELKEKGRFKQPERSGQPAWAYPVVVGGKLYIRDWDNMFCYDVKAP